MGKPFSFRWSLIFFLLLSCFFDIYSTISDSNFLSLESNLILPNIYITIIFKILFCVGLSYIFYRIKPKNNRHIQFFYINMIVLLVFIQLMAGMNNIYIKHQTMDNINTFTGTNYTEFKDVPADMIEQTALPKDVAMSSYLKIMLSMFYIPFGLSLLSFYIWGKMFYEKL